MIYNLNDYRDTIINIFKHSNYTIYDDRYLLSILGTRICYSSKDPLTLINEDSRIVDLTKRFELLQRLAKAGHHSVFAHTPILVKKSFKWRILEAVGYQLPYKVWYCKGSKYVLANARHLVELLNIRHKDVLIRQPCAKPKQEMFYSDLTKDKIEVSTAPVKSDRYLFLIYYDIPDYGWLVVIAYNISRVCTHQWVRHTWLNFSQRSHRYTKVDNVVLPESIKRLGKDEVDTYYKLIEESSRWYTYFKNRVPNEDARFIAPTGSCTTLMASGPLFVWQDFVSKRSAPEAQWEIRRIAQTVKIVLDMLLEQV